jgi:cytoskeletal protein CcmA (bactofilin family)
MSIRSTMPHEQDAVAEERPATQSLINAQTVIDGDVSTTNDLRIEGRVSGSVVCGGVLFVADGAQVDATVEADGVVVEGTLSGTIRCRGRLEIRPTGSVTGEVDTQRLVILEGAIYEGRLRMDSQAGAAETESPEVAQEEAEPTPNPYSFLRNAGPVARPAPTPDLDLPASDSDEEPS